MQLLHDNVISHLHCWIENYNIGVMLLIAWCLPSMIKKQMTLTLHFLVPCSQLEGF